MNFRRLFLILTLISAFLLLIVGYFKYSATGPQSVAAPTDMVIATAHPVATGALITADAIVFVPRPKDATAGVYFDRQIADTPGGQPDADRATQSEILGAVARHSYDSGQAITRDSVVKPGDSGFLAAVLRPGMRAITIGVTAVSGAAGLVYPGDHVDLLLTQTFSGELALNHHSVAETVAQDLRVLAIDQQLQSTAQKGGKLAQTVTLEATPRQASDIDLAKDIGELSLVIRSLQPGAIPSQPAGNVVWAEDVSPALNAVESQAPSRQVPAQKVLILRGESAEVYKFGP